MKSRITIGAALGVIAGLVLGVSVVPASSQQAATTKTFKWCEKPGAGFFHSIDVGRKGPSAGDYDVDSTPVLSTSTGKRVATDVGRFTTVWLSKKGNSRVIAEDTFIAGGGRLTAYGAYTYSGVRNGVNLAITGGTGIYQQADGFVTMSFGKCRGSAGEGLSFRVTVQ